MPSQLIVECQAGAVTAWQEARFGPSSNVKFVLRRARQSCTILRSEMIRVPLFTIFTSALWPGACRYFGFERVLKLPIVVAGQ